MRLQLIDLLSQPIGTIAEAADHAYAARVGHGRGKERAGGHAHAGEHDGVFYAEDVGQGGLDSFCGKGGC